MKKFLVLLGLVVAVGAASYFVCFHRAMASVVVVTPDGTDAELAWLKREFALTSEQYDKVVAAHHAYRPVCADHCMRYVAAHHRLLICSEPCELVTRMDAAIAEQASIQGDATHRCSNMPTVWRGACPPSRAGAISK